MTKRDSQFKDLFSTQASDYAKYRPTYPKALYEYLATLCKERTLAWDVGTGNGQAAQELAALFAHVHATDPSQKQLHEAKPHRKITYEVASAESCPTLKNQSVDLITVAQAFHWFQHDAFFQEAMRALKPGGVICAWGYALTEITPEIDQAVMHLYQDLLENYWDPERKLVEQHYKPVALPASFQEIQWPGFEMNVDWSFDEFAGYLMTWSALQKYLKANGSAPIEKALEKIKSAWAIPSHEKRRITWPLFARTASFG